MNLQEPQIAGQEPVMELADLLHRTTRRLHRGTGDALAPLGLSISEARVVRLVAEEPLRMAVIADRLHVVPRTVTDIVDGAELAGVVARRPDPEDRRSTLVELTPAGRLLLDRLDSIRRESAARVFGALDGTQRAQLLALLRVVCASEQCSDEAGHGGGHPPGGRHVREPEAERVPTLAEIHRGGAA